MEKPLTLQEINELYKKTYFHEDEAILPLIISIVVGSRLTAPAVWLYLIGPTSGGKTTLLSILNKVDYVHLVSDLTANTFLSGLKSNKKETSLLKRFGENFVMVMKDFTTLLSKSPDTQEAIIGQMREIYDGHLRKETGLGDTIEWGTKEKPNKATLLMAATEGIFKVQEKFSDMGTRAVNYVLEEQDGKKATKMALRKNNKAESEMTRIQEEVKKFVNYHTTNRTLELPPLPEEIEDEIINIAELSERCRSVVLRDYRGEKSLALSAGLPMRLAKQMLSAGQFMKYCNAGVLTPALLHAIYKVGLDSIPKQRRLVLNILARHPRVNVVGVATEINYPSKFTRDWIEDLNMFGVCTHIKSKNKDFWELKEEYRLLLQKHLGIVPVDYDLDVEESTSSSDEEVDRSWMEQENITVTKRNVDDSFNTL